LAALGDEVVERQTWPVTLQIPLIVAPAGRRASAGATTWT
jgi:hypothetical protein